MSKGFSHDEPSTVPMEGDGNLDRAEQIANRLFAAEQSTETELNMTFWEALMLYPKASMWSILISFAVVMEGKWLS
jgi:hypothetical protein